MKLFLITLLLITNTLHALPEDIQSFFQASKELETLVIESRAQRELPRISDSKAAKLLSIVSDQQRFIHSIPYEVQDLGVLIDLCDRANVHQLTYMMSGADNLSASEDADLNSKNFFNLIVKNVNSYSPELTLLQPFTIYCLAKQLPLMEVFMSNLPPAEMTEIRRQGIIQGRNGMIKTITGIVQAATENSNPEFAGSYRTAILKSLTDTIPFFSRMLNISARQQLLAWIAGIPDTQKAGNEADFIKIMTALQQPECEGLCLIS